MNSFENVTLLVTHYNRTKSLEHLLKSFEDQNIQFGDIVISDDGSKEKHLEKLKSLAETYQLRLILAPQNKGLGNNINKGQKGVTTAYTLYVQEDFVPKPLFAEKLTNAIQFMEERSDFDMVRFYAYFKYPFSKPFRNGFSEMMFNASPWYFSYRKFYFYSDHPHLRRSNFLEKFGKYNEGTSGDVTEYQMMMSVIQKNGKGVFYDDYQGLFDQQNSLEEPSTMTRTSLRESKNLLITAVRHLYRHIKFNFDYHFSKYTNK
ncbi:MAG: glycosyltransferase family 2 protein [Sphingobacteriales bacterium]|nr:glycosyltransferase family 2 protein [Sphingobacteriales bacterium]